MNKTINIAIVEDNRAFAESLQKMIKISNILTCSAVFNTAEEVLDVLEHGETPNADIILLDLHLPGKNGLTLVPVLHKHMPRSHIIVLTQNNDYLTTLEAIQLGVSGYILKTASIIDIRNTVFEVYDGGCVIDPQLSRLVLSTLSSGSDLKHNPLTKRECEVLELMAMGYVKKEVAHRLNLSYATVAQSTERIYHKLQVPNIASAVATAIRKGLI